MKLLKYGTTLLRSVDGKLLKVREDTYVDPLPEVFMVQVQVEEGQSITLPTPALGASPYVDLFMDFYNVKEGIIIASDDSSAGNLQPQLTRSCLANTEYLLK